MSNVTFFIFLLPALASLIVIGALLHECERGWRHRPRNEAEEKAMVLLRSWLTPEQDKQWATRHEFDVVGCDTGTRYRVTYRPVMNVHQLDEDGLTMAQWCFAPAGGLAPGDVLLAQKIALETMEREALALANCQRIRFV